jgi:glycosyltransferase involved in cell wall biosynthesis
MRVLHAPHDIAGQASYIVLKQKELGIKADLLIFDRYFAMRYFDINLSLSEKTTMTKLFVLSYNFIKCFFRYDVFHFHFGESLLPRNLDLPILKFFGKKIVMSYYGSDIRRYDVAKNYVYHKNLDELEKIYPEKDDKNKLKRIKDNEKYVNITIVDDYPLLVYSPKSIVVPMVIDIAKFDFIGCENKNEKIKIVHAPTHREKKGTKYVLAAIERLKEEKYNIDFILVEKRTNNEVIEICKKADIIVDQLILESHGVFLIENMALGKPVLCRIDEKLMKFYPDMPILRTDPDNIYENLKLLIENPDLRKELGERGRKYVEEKHDSRKIAKQLIDLYKRI